jgi:hypothetical protein
MLSEPVNGRMSRSPSNAVDSVVSFSCLPGFTLVGSATRRCNSSHQWTGVQPICQVVDNTSNSTKRTKTGDYPSSVITSLHLSPMIVSNKISSPPLHRIISLTSTMPIIKQSRNNSYTVDSMYVFRYFHYSATTFSGHN